MTFITISEFHERLDGALSMNTLYRMVEDGKIPGAVQPSGKGGRWLIPENALEVMSSGDKEQLGASA